MRFAILSLTLVLSVIACAKNSSSGGTATLTWNPVKTDSRGKALTDVAGYKIYYGTSANAMHTVVVLKNPTQTTYIVKDLHPGTWYFAISAYTTSGTEGSLSNIGSKTIK